MDNPNMHAYGEDASDDAEIGRQWREDSSLEKWFPLTAEQLAAKERENLHLAREARAWWGAAQTYAKSEAKLVKALRDLVELEDMRLRLRQLHEMGHGTDYADYHRLLPLAWAAAREALGPNVRAKATAAGGSPLSE